MTKEWSGFTVQEYKKFKNLKKENLRDNMTNIELVLNMLAEVTTTEILKTKRPKGMTENTKVAKEGGKVAKNARKDIEKRIGKKVVTKANAKNKEKLMIENKKSNSKINYSLDSPIQVMVLVKKLKIVSLKNFSQHLLPIL